ncbi:cytochrome o ubiquinol oxidase subunit IV [Paracoccus sp. 1_MG-2023]|uniref:cytochrome o ubiquinol oxidase subunit IV n=1 Tax=unclassified Paracoccus (in: a-proteobacteria) TaxID=2688777 RepID=UPI001C09EE16|nr:MULTISPECIES: cytochrome o ubiquinol oxidase subunit IV [unclassified Paracoccus (in: a-proteobacteria)]MBU2956329.1 cytochrome o ubiquinol oxidase subunit IV [Paracoccus sp. C2R09]MDO6668005.1 cytochrome o ubiquinol oxidase subunit IV [Paracoccus sp. 1_MG-2023]
MSAHDNDAHGSYKSYLIGFGLSVVLTLIPFGLVIGEFEMSLPWAVGIIFGLGAIQILVHVHYFLHVTFRAENGWQFMSLVFTATLLFIVLAGSVWVMFHLNENMMPSHDQIERVRNLP